MSTIASPRLSTTSFSTDTSRRLSLDSHIRSQATSPARPARRNKAALRDYYGLKSTAAAPADTHSGGRQPSPPVPEITQSKLDAPGFDAEAYVHDLLARESLQGLLKVESGLVNEIRALDGEKKALVYDNYSKLITATDTIRKVWSAVSMIDKKVMLGSLGIRVDENEYGSAHADDVDAFTCHCAYCRNSRLTGEVCAG